MVGEGRLFPPWFAPVMVAIFLAVVLVGGFFANPRRSEPPFYLGCYQTDGGPDILVEARRLRILQVAPVDVPYTLEYHKGWTLTIDGWLDFRQTPSGMIEVNHGDGAGQFLFLSREGVVTPRELGFYLIDRASLTTVRYVKTRQRCAS